MSTNRLQEYFDANPVTQIGRGSQSIVYGADQLVVKKFNTKWYLKLLELFGGIETFLRDQYQIVHKKGLENLGDLAVPYTVPDQLRITVRNRVFTTLTSERTLEHPVVQVRTLEKDTLGSHLRQADQQKDLAKAMELLEKMLATNRDLAELDFHAMDVIASNYTVDQDGRVKIQDIGALVIGEFALEAARLRRELQLANNLFAMKLHLVKLWHEPGFQQAFAEIERKFREEYLTKPPQRVARGVNRAERRARGDRERAPNQQTIITPHRMPADILAVVQP